MSGGEFGLGDDLLDEDDLGRRGERRSRSFDAGLLKEPVAVLSLRKPVICSPSETVTESVRAMQRENQRCVVVTEDGTSNAQVTGIFTESDVLFRIVDRGRNPAVLPLSEAMTPDPGVLLLTSSVAHLLNRMTIDRFQHLPIVDAAHHPVSIVSARDVIEFLVKTFPREILNLPAEQEGKPQKEREGA
jgi:CBS domain-containing protein